MLSAQNVFHLHGCANITTVTRKIQLQITSFSGRFFFLFLSVSSSWFASSCFQLNELFICVMIWPRATLLLKTFAILLFSAKRCKRMFRTVDRIKFIFAFMSVVDFVVHVGSYEVTFISLGVLSLVVCLFQEMCECFFPLCLYGKHLQIHVILGLTVLVFLFNAKISFFFPSASHHFS